MEIAVTREQQWESSNESAAKRAWQQESSDESTTMESSNKSMAAGKQR